MRHSASPTGSFRGESPAAPELAAALEGLLWQCRQMAGMFPDEDGTIATAMADAEKALLPKVI